MGIIPSNPRADFMEWCAIHAEVFVDNAVAIGLTPTQATNFKSAVNDTGDAIFAQGAARETAKTRTVEANQAVGKLRADAANLLRIIRTFAQNSANPESVYNLAQIPPPAQPSPLPPPAQPGDLRVTLDAAIGNLTLRWKASNPPGAAGTSYVVWRRLPDEAEFSFVGVTGSKKYIDMSLVAGPDMVQYMVQGQRSGLSGPMSEVFTVNFGRAPGGQRTAFVVASQNAASPSPSPLMAAARGGSGGQMSGRSRSMGSAANGADGSHSTVNGQPVQKTLPGASHARGRGRR